VLLVTEVALALVLLVGAGLMFRTVASLVGVDPGIETKNLLTARFNLPWAKYREERLRSFYREVLEKTEALPGVRSAAFTISLPIDGSRWGSVFVVDDRPVPERGKLPSSAFTPVSVGFFRTMRIRLLQGRAFGEADGAGAPFVCLVNESFARHFWPEGNALGKRVKQGWPENTGDGFPWREIVGIVADVKLNGVDSETPMQVYLPLLQHPSRELYLVVRTASEPSAATAAVRGVIQGADADVPVYSLRTMEQVLGESIGTQRLALGLLGAFAGLALLLAAIGTYGVLSYGVTQRTQEIGLRMTLGAQRLDIFRLIVGQGMSLAILGVGIGAVGALLLTDLMTSMLFGVKPTDAATFVTVAAVLLVVALTACWIPARRATRTDPLAALRYE
jgi:putative ABC transport system permease protein